MVEIAVTFGLAFVIVFYYFTTKDLIDKPKDSLNKKIWGYLAIKDLAVLLHIITAFLVLGFVGFLANLSASESFFPTLEMYFIIFAVLITAFFIGYFSIYIIFRIKEEMLNAVSTKWKK